MNIPSQIADVMDCVLKDYKSGMTMGKLCHTYGVSHPTLTKIFREFGIDTRSKANRLSEFHPELIDLYEEGMSVLNLSEKYGVSQRTIREILYKNNVKMRPKGRKKR